jgi:hypothetical protein
MRVARVGIGLLALAFGVAIGVRGLAAQQQRQVFVSVVDSRGVPVLDLRADAFKVFENQMPARTIKVEPIEWPMKLTVLVDNGLGSDDYLANLRTGLRNFFNEIPDEVEMSLLTLAPQPRWVIKPTTELEKLIKGVDLITPDPGISRFFDGLSEAAARFDKEKGREARYFPVIVMVTSDVGSVDAPFAQDYERFNKRIRDDALTVHFVLVSSATQKTIGGVIGNVQTHVGLAATGLSGGRYENISAPSRLVTLLPEIGQQIAKSHFRQTHQYRVTYEMPAGAPKDAPKDLSVSVNSSSAVSIEPTRDGHLP